MPRTIALTLVILAVGLGLAACGGDEETGSTTTEETTTDGATPVGREIFVANCGTCHTLSDAGTTGTIGPSLDGIGVTTDRVEEQVRSGGGGMPAFEDTLSDEEIQEVAAYVVAAQSG
jgi:mono/diheme cytochrome c family protein